MTTPRLNDQVGANGPALVRANMTRRFEAYVGVFFALAVVSFVTAAGLASLWDALGDAGRFWPLAFAIGPLVACEVACGIQFKLALEDAHHPFAPWFALNRRRWPPLVRPVVAIWWSAHFAVGLTAVVVVENLVAMAAATWGTRLAHMVAFFVVGFTVAYSANLYALLAVSAVSANPAWVNRVWRGRLVLDLAVGALAVTAPVIHRF